MITQDQAELLASAINVLRPDWPTKQITTIIGRNHQHRLMRDVGIALMWVALDDDSRTPARINEADGPWWKAAAVDRSSDRTARAPSPRDGEICTIDGHSGWAGNCSQCRADQLAASPEPEVEVAS